MSRKPRLTDDVLKSALALEPALPATPLLPAIAADVRTTPQVGGRPRLLTGAIAGGRALGLRRSWAVLVATALLFAALAGTFAGAQLLREEPRLPTWPTPPDRWVLSALPEPPVALTDHQTGFLITPVSADEAWVSNGEALWHFADGAWTMASGPWTAALPPRSASQALFEYPELGSIAIGPDGTVWGITAPGLARWDGQRWEIVIEDDAIRSLVVAADGTAWAGTLGYLYRVDARTNAVSAHFCGVPSVVTAAADGSVYVWGTGWRVGHQLWRLAEGSCTRLDPPWDGTSVWVEGVAALPDGAVSMLLRERDLYDSQQGRLARFDGVRWTDLGEAGVSGSVQTFVADPSGTVWRVAPPPFVIERLDAGTWTTVDVGAPTDRLAIAADGSVWFATTDGFSRLLPRWDDPSRRE